MKENLKQYVMDFYHSNIRDGFICFGDNEYNLDDFEYILVESDYHHCCIYNKTRRVDFTIFKASFNNYLRRNKLKRLIK